MIYDPYIKTKRDPFSPYYGYRKRRDKEKKILRRAIFIFLILILIFFVMKIIHHPTYGVFINGKPVVYLKSKKDITRILKRIEKEKTKGYKDFKYKDEIEIEKVKDKNIEVYNLEETYQKLKKEVTIEVKTKVLKINGNDILAGDEKEIKNALEKIKKKYSAYHQEKLGKINFKEKIQIYDRYVRSENIKNEEEILKLLTGSKSVNYIVQKGDLGSTIAKKFRTTVSALKLKNPKVNFDNLKIGESLKIKDSSYLTVVTQKISETKEKIPPPAIIIKTNRLFSGQTEIRQKGKDGEKERITLLTYENGKLVSKELLKEKILKEPTIQVIVKGTKER